MHQLILIFNLIVLIDYSDRNHCMRSIVYSGYNNTFVFIGDFRLKNMYAAFKKHFFTNSVGDDKIGIVLDPFAEQPNLTFSDNLLRLKADFIWAPYISKSVFDLLNTWKVNS